MCSMCRVTNSSSAAKPGRWDCWGVILNEQLDNPDDLSLLDDIAALTANDVPEFETVRARYQSDPRLRVDGTLLSYVDGNMVQVNVT